MGILSNVVINAKTFVEAKFGNYFVAGSSLNAPQNLIRVNPGSTAVASKGSTEKRRTASWVVTDQYDIASPSPGQPTRQAVQATVLINSGMDITEAQINACVDSCSAIPDGGRLSLILQGAS